MATVFLLSTDYRLLLFMFFTDSYRALRHGERRRAVKLVMLSVLTLAVIFLPLGFIMLRRFEASATFHPERAPWGGRWQPPDSARPTPRSLSTRSRGSGTN